MIIFWEYIPDNVRNSWNKTGIWKIVLILTGTIHDVFLHPTHSYFAVSLVLEMRKTFIWTRAIGIFRQLRDIFSYSVLRRRINAVKRRNRLLFTTRTLPSRQNSIASFFFLLHTYLVTLVKDVYVSIS